MKAKTVNEAKFNSAIRGPAKYNVSADEMSFSFGQTPRYGYNGNKPKISATIGGVTRGKAFIRGENSLPHEEEIYKLITDFLNQPDTKGKIAKIINHDG